LEEPVSDLVLNALRRNLSVHGNNPARVARIRKRIAEREKATSTDLADRTKAELLGVAAEQEIEGRHQMTKAELVEALTEGDE
jgi:hypothetical protein